MIEAALCKISGSQFIEKNRNGCGKDAFVILLRLSNFEKESDIGNWTIKLHL